MNECLSDIYLSDVVTELERDFSDLPLENYSEAFHNKAVTLIDKARLDIRKAFFNKLLIYFGISLDVSKLGEDSRISPRFIEIEELLLDVWRILSLKWAIQDVARRYGKHSDPSLVFAYFKTYTEGINAKKLLGNKIDSAFFDKAFAIADELYASRFQKLKTSLKSHLNAKL